MDTNSTYYASTDHLGSGDLIMNSAGTVLARESFTPFGARRGSAWTGLPSAVDNTTFAQTTRRGFTGHEMLDAVNLIHMNGRVYDPQIGRFLSADPIVQTINVSQALNPFSYVMNNPLALIDPSGYSWLSKIFHAIGNFFQVPETPNVFGTNTTLVDGPESFWKNFWKQGGGLSNVMNEVPGMHSLARLHDYFQIWLGPTESLQRWVFNVPAMVPATAINYGALLGTVSGYTAIVDR